jgi:hypothetical protein
MYSKSFQPSGPTPLEREEMRLGLDEESIYTYDNRDGGGKRQIKYVGSQRVVGPPPPPRLLYRIFMFRYADNYEERINLTYANISTGRRNGNFTGGLAR